MSFSYTNLTPASQPYYEKLLALDAAKFFAWRAKTAYDRDLPLETAFRRWWMGKGPVAFKTYDETFRYRKELWELVLQTPSAT